MKFFWETHPNPDYQTLHCQHRFPTVYIDDYADGKVSDKDRGRISAELVELAESIAAIDGVVSTSLRGYEVRVELAKMFDWPTIRARVVELVGKFVPLTEETEPDAQPAYSDDDDHY